MGATQLPQLPQLPPHGVPFHTAFRKSKSESKSKSKSKPKAVGGGLGMAVIKEPSTTRANYSEKPLRTYVCTYVGR